MRRHKARIRMVRPCQAHPDKHPPERRELAKRVTAELLALKPFAFPAPQPEPRPEPKERPSPLRDADITSPRLPSFPCAECAYTIPLYYCTACRTEWEDRQHQKDDRLRARQRELYKRRQEQG